jgi:DnaJ-class molecular chaperone
MKDPYESLGVGKTATQDEIKNAYRKLAKKLHPDLNPGSKEAETKFKEVAAAYEILGDPANRAKFDRGEWEQQPGSGPQGHGGYYRQARPGADGRYDFHFGGSEGGDFEDVFAQFFRDRGDRRDWGGRGQGFEAAGDEIYQMEVDMRDAILGAEREITLPSGKRLQVKIPKGVGEGMRLRFSGQGAAVNGKAADVYVEIRFREDPRFLREGRDLFLELPVSVVDAALGAELRVPTPEGEVLLKVPPHTDSGRRMRIPGKGVAVKGGKERGDLTVIVKLVLPAGIDGSFDQAMRDWKEKRQAGERSAS